MTGVPCGMRGFQIDREDDWRSRGNARRAADSYPEHTRTDPSAFRDSDGVGACSHRTHRVEAAYGATRDCFVNHEPERREGALWTVDALPHLATDADGCRKCRIVNVQSARVNQLKPARKVLASEISDHDNRIVPADRRCPQRPRRPYPRNDERCAI